MKKYFKYGIEALHIGGIYLFLISIRYFFFKKTPSRYLKISNPVMGIFECRKGTIDFMFSFFSYEYKIKNKILCIIDQYDTFIDIGACIGDYSIWMAKNGLKSIAFEPNPDNYKCLQRNISLNNFETEIIALNYGLGTTNETVTFKTHPENKGFSGKYVTSDNAIHHQVDIKIFDEIFKDLGLTYDQKIIMKIDAEGMEAEIIAGAMHFFQNIKKVFLIFESHTSEQDIIDQLQRMTSIELIQIDNLNKGVVIENR